MKKFVVYTAMVGEYDNIHQPSYIDDSFDYILFSDCAEETQIGVWSVRRINYFNPNRIKVARWAKTHACQLLPEYEMSVWVDASVDLQDSYVFNKAISLYKQGVNIATMTHSKRDCIYDEMFAVFKSGYEEIDVLAKWHKKLERELYPRHNGLSETGLVYRAHNDIVLSFESEWWNCIERYSRRDQLSFNYVAWRLKISVQNLLEDGENVISSSHFNVIPHKGNATKILSEGKNIFRLLRYYATIENGDAKLREVYEKLCESKFPSVKLVCRAQLARCVMNVSHRLMRRG